MGFLSAYFRFACRKSMRSSSRWLPPSLATSASTLRFNRDSKRKKQRERERERKKEKVALSSSITARVYSKLLLAFICDTAYDFNSRLLVFCFRMLVNS